MNAQQLMLEDGTKLNSFRCSACGTIYNRDRSIADECCVCVGCGQTHKPHEMMYQRWCSKCWPAEEARRRWAQIERAVEVHDYAGPVWDGNNYFRDIDEFVGQHEGDLPEFVFACHVLRWTLDAADILQDLYENASLEDGPDFDGVREFEAACNAFNEANKSLEYWDADCGRKVRVPKPLHDPLRADADGVHSVGGIAAAKEKQ